MTVFLDPRLSQISSIRCYFYHLTTCRLLANIYANSVFDGTSSTPKTFHYIFGGVENVV